MPESLKRFEWLGYGAVILQMASSLVGSFDVWTGFGALVVTIFVALLIFITARRAQNWAAWVLVVLTLMMAIGTIGEFWVFGPNWIREILKPDAPPSMLEKFLDVVSTVMLVVGLWCYFFGAERRRLAVANGAPNP